MLRGCMLIEWNAFNSTDVCTNQEVYNIYMEEVDAPLMTWMVRARKHCPSSPIMATAVTSTGGFLPSCRRSV